MTLDLCLPPDLRGPDTTVTRVAAGLSGAGVYRVDAGGRAYALKVGAPDADVDRWRHTLDLQRHAAAAGVAPRVIHVDESRRAVLSDFVTDRGFVAQLRTPATHAATVALLGRTVRAVHALPLASRAGSMTPHAFLSATWDRVSHDGFAKPDWVVESVERVLAEAPPEEGARPEVTSHNDLNPSNLVFDGERLVLLDWDTAGLNDPWFDLATLTLFLTMDDATAMHMVAAYDAMPDGEPPRSLPPRFRFVRRMVAALCGANFLDLAQRGGHAGERASTPGTALSLGGVYQALRAGTLQVASSEGQWAFGLALLRESVAAR